MLIAAGLDGIQRGLTPPAPALHDPVNLNDEERRASNVRPLPASQAEALQNLENDDVLTSALGDLMTRCYLATRRAEFAKGEAKGLEWARAATFTVY